jgi:hypothetical protein
MREVGPILVSVCVAMQCILLPLNETSFLEFANSFFEGTELEKKVLQYKKDHCGYKEPKGKEGCANLGSKYYKGFMKHHETVLWSKKPHKFPKDRKDWATYENIEKMYEQVYQAMVECGIAHYLDDDEVNAVLEHPELATVVC